MQDNFRFQTIINYHFKLKLFTNLMRKIEEKVMIILSSCTTLEKLAFYSFPDSEIQDQHTNISPRHVKKSLSKKEEQCQLSYQLNTQ